jgi:hypothetical protein
MSVSAPTRVADMSLTLSVGMSVQHMSPEDGEPASGAK